MTARGSPYPSRVAIVHYWLVAVRGGEHVLKELASLYPTADIYTLVLQEDVVERLLPGRRVIPSILQRIPRSNQFHQYLLPLARLALERFDLRGYDLVISSESGPAKGVLVPPHTLHLCYCHTPMRYIWHQYEAYRQHLGLLPRAGLALLLNRLRSWDRATAARVSAFAANSQNVRRRILRYYGRESGVIYPPVRTSRFRIGSRVDDFYLCVSQLVPYKRIDIAVEAFRQSGRTLLVVGDGPERNDLERMRPPNVSLLGSMDDDSIADLLARCRGFVFPGEEDFGIAPVEAMSSGRPVIAYGRGGALETVSDGVTGVFFNEQTPEALNHAIRRLEQIEPKLDPKVIRDHVLKFDESVFRENVTRFVQHNWDVWESQRNAR